MNEEHEYVKFNPPVIRFEMPLGTMEALMKLWNIPASVIEPEHCNYASAVANSRTWSLPK